MYIVAVITGILLVALTVIDLLCAGHDPDELSNMGVHQP